VVNLTLTIDEAVLRRARIRALEQHTSVNAVVREFLEAYAGVDERVAAMAMFLDIAERSGAGAAGVGRSWRRDDIYDERTAG
jgi:plasmid stability protein